MPARRAREAEIAVIRPAQPRTPHQAIAGATERRLPGAMEVPIEQVAPDPAQPRRDWGHNDGGQRMDELAASIREFGILQPLVVREDGTLNDGRQRYVLIAGARRRMAAERAGLTVVPILLRDEPTTKIRVLQLIENLQRQELSPLDEARAYQELIDLENLSPPDLAGRLHISAQHVRDRLRVLADQVLADAVERRQIAASTARDIMKLPDEEITTFRFRVQSGERLQLNDIATARARLAAEGVVNPRRKRPPAPEQTVFVPASDAPGVPEDEAPRGAAAAEHAPSTQQNTPRASATVPPLPEAERQAQRAPGDADSLTGAAGSAADGSQPPLRGALSSPVIVGPEPASPAPATASGAALLDWLAARSRFAEPCVAEPAEREAVIAALEQLITWAAALRDRLRAEDAAGQ